MDTDKQRRAEGTIAMVIIVMGVSGAGKSTVGRMLAREMGWQFYDGDDLHPAVNKEKMHRGIPLTDADRWPWLDAIRRLIERCLSDGTSAVIACSALKQSYRDRLLVDPAAVKFVYLKGSMALIAKRIKARTGHFMNKHLLQSQFDDLEEPRDAITVEVSGTPQEIAGAIRKRVGK